MKRLLSTFCFAALAAAAGTVAFPDAVTLDNGHIRVGVSPAAGRIVDFAPSGGGNLLWLNTGAEVREQRGSGRWVNYGGDRLWPELYNYWRSIRRVNIPDPQIDGGGWVLVERAPLARHHDHADRQRRLARRPFRRTIAGAGVAPRAGSLLPGGRFAAALHRSALRGA